MLHFVVCANCGNSYTQITCAHNSNTFAKLIKIMVCVWRLFVTFIQQFVVVTHLIEMCSLYTKHKTQLPFLSINICERMRRILHNSTQWAITKFNTQSHALLVHLCLALSVWRECRKSPNHNKINASYRFSSRRRHMRAIAAIAKIFIAKIPHTNRICTKLFKYPLSKNIKSTSIAVVVVVVGVGVFQSHNST